MKILLCLCAFMVVAGTRSVAATVTTLIGTGTGGFSDTEVNNPYGLAIGPDGALWFLETDGNQLGRITTSGAITEYRLPALNRSPVQIASGPDGALWFAEAGANMIGRAVPAPSMSEFSAATGASARTTRASP